MGYEVSFPFIIGGTPLVNGDYGICMDLPPPTSKNEDKMKYYPRIILFPVTTISVSGCWREFPMQNKATRILKHIETKENYTS